MTRKQTETSTKRNVRVWLKRGDSQRWTKLARFQRIVGGSFGKDGEVIRFGNEVFRLTPDGSVWVTVMPR